MVIFCAHWIAAGGLFNLLRALPVQMCVSLCVKNVNFEANLVEYSEPFVMSEFNCVFNCRRSHFVYVQRAMFLFLEVHVHALMAGLRFCHIN